MMKSVDHFWKNILAAGALSQMPAYHLIIFLQKSHPDPYYPQTILLPQITKESNHNVPKTPLPAEKCTSHEKCTIIPTRKMCITTQLWVVLGFRAIIQLCSVQGTNQTLNMDHVQFYLARYLVLHLNLVNPTRLLFSFSACSCSHLPLCSYNSAAVITLTKCGDESWIITFYLEPCHAGRW